MCGNFIDPLNSSSEKQELISSTNGSDVPTLPQLETEIKLYLNQITKNFIEVGKRLIQAKSLVKHGEWQKWLEDNFQLSQNTAGRFMQCANRFSNSEMSQNLNQSQMIALLSLPSPEETEKFIEQKASLGTPIENMTVKTLRQEIKNWKSETENDSNLDSYRDKTNTIIESTEITEQEDYAIRIPFPTEPGRQQFYGKAPVEKVSTEKILDDNIPECNIDIDSFIEQFFIASDYLGRIVNLNESIRKFIENDTSRLNFAFKNINFILSEIRKILNEN